MAILNPFNSYSRPPRLGGGLHVPRWVGLAFVVAVVLIIDLSSNSMSTTSDGGVLIDVNEITWGHSLAVIAGLTIGAAFLLIRWWNFRWWVEEDAIWTTGGIVNRWRRRVALGQIATIDRSATPIRRIFGVSRIAIETTAHDQAAPDVLFGYLSNRNAALLEDLLISKLVFEDSDGTAHRFDPINVDRLGWWKLFLAGATTLQLARAFAVLYAASQLLQDESSPSLVIDSEQTAYGLSPTQFLLVQILSIIGVVWLTSTLYFVVSFARFRLGKHGGWLIIETGVITRSRRLINADAIQGLEIFRSPLQRYFRNKRAMLRMRLPAYGSPPIYAMVLHPAITDAALPRLAQQVIGMDMEMSAAMCGKGVHRLGTACRGAYITYWPLRIAAVSAMVLALLLPIDRDLWWWALTPASLIVPFALRGYLAWKSAGWYVNDGDWLLIQRGVLGLTSTAARTDQVQYIQWSRGLFSRSSPTVGLTVSVSTSGGMGIVSQILAFFHRAIDPSIIKMRAVDVESARSIAASSGFERSLPPGVIREPQGTALPGPISASA